MKACTIPGKQKGLSMLGWMVIIGIAVFFVILGMKLVPSYIEYYSIKTVLRSLQEDRQANQRTVKQIRDTIIKRLKINGVYEFDRENIKIKKEKNQMRVNVVYEERKKMVGNIDVVMHFEDQVDL